MKSSRFNSFLPHKGKIIGYNSFSDRFLLMEPFLHDLLQAAIRENDLPGLSEIHPQMVTGLEEHGFLVPVEKDELEAAKEKSREVDHDDKSFHLIVNPTMNCNFKCWYCYESHIKGSKMNARTIEKLKHFVVGVMDDNPQLEHFLLSWFGGEPLLHFKQVIVELSEFVYRECAERGIELVSAYITNGFLIKKEMVPAFHKYNTQTFQITLDGHREQHNQVRFVSKSRGSYDEIISNIKLLARNDLRVSIRVNYTPDNLPDVDKIFDDLADLEAEARAQCTVSLHKVWQSEEAAESDLHSKFDILKAKGIPISTEFNRPGTLFSSCYADKRMQATVNFNGDAFKCTARDFTKANREGVLDESGKIEWNEIYEKRMQAKFRNKPCLSCRILPLCNGGCSQVMLDNWDKDYCVYDGDESKKDEVIMNRFLYLAK